jgi:hypothetical protein
MRNNLHGESFQWCVATSQTAGVGKESMTLASTPRTKARETQDHVRHATLFESLYHEELMWERLCHGLYEADYFLWYATS